jgi:tRNA pseudouridine38-40 synthase
MEASMALGGGSGLVRPSVARQGGCRPFTAAFVSHRRRISSRASAADEAPASAPASAPFPDAPHARKHRKDTEGTRGDRRRETRDLRAPAGVRLEDVPVASDALPERTHPSHRLAPDVRRDPNSFTEHFRKKPTALLVGYAGGNYKGNTVNHELPRGSTVDDVLEDALFKSGGVKLSNYRSRALGRLKWSRSSRTDKGVSSLATVVSLRLELDPSVWDPTKGGDYEAKALCEKINSFLPEDVKVFGAYSTPKSFQARRACVKRTYDYLLPARCLGIFPAGTSPSGDIPSGDIPSGDTNQPWPGAPRAAGQSPARTMSLFREALTAFEGSHYFHNYTRRAAYARSKDWDASLSVGGPNSNGGRRRRGSRVSDPMDADADVLESEAEEQDASAEDSDDSVSSAEESSGARFVGSRRDGVYWLLERDDDDLVGIKHNRRIESFVASDVQTLRLKTKDEDESHMSEPFVRVTVRGDSFMLYQIRKMIATAVAVALGHYPAELIPASLARPARVVTPIAPPTTLYLHEAEFVPFAKNKSQKSKASDDDDDDDGERKGNGATRHNTRDFVELETVNHRPDRLVPSSATRFAIERFREDTLDPALGPALASDEWDVFVSNLFRSRVWTRDGKGEKQSRSVAEVLAAFGPYAAERSARKRELREMDAVLEAKAGEGLET